MAIEGGSDENVDFSVTMEKRNTKDLQSSSKKCYP